VQRTLAPLALAALTGVLGFLGFIGFGLYPLVFVAWVPILYAIRALSPPRTVLLGLVFGTVLNVGGYYWIVHALTSFGDLSRPGAVLALVALCVYQGSMLALVLYMVRRAEVDLGLKPIWTLPIAYPALEFVYPQLFPANFGAALYTLSTLTQIVEITGVLGLTALVAVVNGAVWELIDARIARRPPSRGQLTFAAGTVLAVVVYGLVRLPMVDAQIAAAPKLKVALVQTNIGAREKSERRDVIARHRQLSEEAIERHADLELVVWPESAYDRRLPRGVSNVSREVTGSLPVPVVFGAITYEGARGRRQFYNTALLASATGDLVARFDKVRLVAFSETLPWIAQWSGLDAVIMRWFPRASFFAPGATFAHFRAANAVLLPTICYEGTLAGFVREFWRRAGPAEALLNLTNDSWFGNSHEPRIHLALASFRSIETRRALIRSTNTGISALVDPAGRIYRRTGQWTSEILTGEVPLIKSGTSPPYQVLGDFLGWSCLGLLGVGWVSSAKARRAGRALSRHKPRP
jgi:apolipoprotein N-acyltransferase